jgi:alanyl-tRNA synthetase
MNTPMLVKTNNHQCFISRELCSGPHVEHTGLIGEIVLAKEKAVADGIRRIYALQKSS